ncbi:MAG: PAS domain-containing protein, partial [Saprospiraceae bacterium]
VTEAHRLRKELEERTRFAELLVESSVDLIAAYDKELRYTVWNQRCVDVLHLKKEDVLGQYVFDVFPTLKGQPITQSLYRALEGQSEYIPPQPSLISDHYYENFVQPLLNDAGEVTGVLTITHDVTESYLLRQELEERSRFAETIIESSVDMIITYDTELRITGWNKKSEEVFQRSKAEVLGHYVQELFPHIIGTERLADLQAVLAGRTMQYEPHELSPFGMHANLYLLPLKDHGGRVTGVLSISHDVTDAVRSAAQLATLNASLEEKNQELANTNAELASFSYVASHDLQEPLRKIQAFGSRILTNENERLSETGKDAFRRMQSAADRMQQLIEDLLTYSRTNTEPGEFATVDLNTILQEAEQEVSEAIQEKTAVIEADQLPRARVMTFQFRQLLANLLSNALKYQRPGVSPHIRITWALVPNQEVPQANASAEQYYRIDIHDNGIGFEQQYAERIFELFQRLHGRSEYKGTGIGLAICRKIMQNHHGYLLAEGRPGAGATFTIYLPV